MHPSVKNFNFCMKKMRCRQGTGTGTWQDYLVNRVDKKDRGAIRGKDIAQKSRNS